MLEEKVKNNLYKIINQYYKILKTQQKRIEPTYEIEKVPSELKLNLLNYETSIFKNIENKQFPFTELFRLKQERIYTLMPIETEILRNYVGIYDNGKKQSAEEVARRLEISSYKVSIILKRIMDIFESETGQLQLILERNRYVKERICEKDFRKQILDSDITFFNITDNFIGILRQENINTVKDLLEITEEQLETINMQYGYYSDLKILPSRLIKEIHEMGLRFKDEIMISQMFHEYNGVKINKRIGLTENVCKYIGTIKDVISARQFEPELLSKLNLDDYLNIDKKINESYMEEKIFDMNQDSNYYVYMLEQDISNGVGKRFRKTYVERNN